MPYFYGIYLVVSDLEMLVGARNNNTNNTENRNNCMRVIKYL